MRHEAQLTSPQPCLHDSSTAAGTGHRPRPLTPNTFRLALLVLFISSIALRSVALSSDPYTHLDWSAGLLTDEGFYIHNARNVALLGHARTDEFNNMLVSPLLHYLQVGVFSTSGVGAIQARLISVVCSLLALLLFCSALRRAFGREVALVGTAFLSLEHVFALFNRMALMDTPATLLAVAAFYAFVLAAEEWRSRGVGESRHSLPLLYSATALLICGFSLGAAVLTRSLCAYLLPPPFVALYAAGKLRGPEGFRRVALIAAPVLLIAVWYGLPWYLPNQAEIVHMNRYYALHQVRPHSLAQLGWNLYHAVLGDHRGIVPYVFRHSPVILSLALFGAASGAQALGCSGGRERRRADERTSGGNESHDHPITESPKGPLTYLITWLSLGALTLSLISYAPGRYYVPLWPPMCALAAIALCRLPAIWPALWSSDPRSRMIRGGLAWLLTYHAIEAAIHHDGILPRAATISLLYGVPTVAAGIAAALALPSGASHSSSLLAPIIALWLITNGVWLADWDGHIRYTQRELSRWLGANLPANSVLIGDVAPGICLDNRFVAVNVIPGLCNGSRPVERFAGRPRYVAILDGRWKEVYWRRNYPEIVERRGPLKLARVLRWDIGIYSVDRRETRCGTLQQVMR